MRGLKGREGKGQEAENSHHMVGSGSIGWVEAQVASLDAAIADLVAKDVYLSRRREVLASIPGLGNVMTYALLADMPELGTMEEGQAAALAGQVPITQQSGTWRGKSSIQGGRATLR